MSFRVLRIVHGPEGGTAALVEHHQHGLAEIIQAEKDGHALIKLRRVAQSDRVLKLRALDNAERILHTESENPQPPPKPPRRRPGKMRRTASGGGA
jgi:hypothetical protein